QFPAINLFHIKYSYIDLQDEEKRDAISHGRDDNTPATAGDAEKSVELQDQRRSCTHRHGCARTVKMYRPAFPNWVIGCVAADPVYHRQRDHLCRTCIYRDSIFLLRDLVLRRVP